MGKRLKAVYENGVFRPLEPVDLAEHQHVTITIDPNGAHADPHQASIVPTHERLSHVFDTEQWLANAV